VRVRAANLVIGYRNRPILNPISFALREGSSCLIVGSNGAGKSTLLRTIVGLQPALQGQAEVAGMFVPPCGLSQLIPAGVRFLGQGERGFRLLRIGDHRNILTRLYGFRTSPGPLFGGAGRRIGSLSVGQRRLEALRMMDCEPVGLFILDEPTAGLDPSSRVQVKEWMKDVARNGKSILAAEHDHGFFSDAFDKLLIMKPPDLVYFGDMLPTDQIGKLIS
jgi:ABC-type multidrug transport system ATPase subunit